MAKKVLGRGLGVYFPEYQSDEEKLAESSREPIAKQKGKSEKPVEVDPADLVNVVLHIPVDDIRANPHQPRKEFDEEKV